MTDVNDTVPGATFPAVTDELLEQVVRRIRSVGAPRAVVLFGSRARGDARPDYIESVSAPSGCCVGDT